VRTGLVAATLAVVSALAISPARAQSPPADPPSSVEETSDLVNALLSGLMGASSVTEKELEDEVAEAGGIPFRQEVPFAFIGRTELSAYLKEVLDAEYPKERARVDERLLQAFDLLPEGTDLRALRARVLEENVAGFYDERPDQRRLFAVSADRSLTPMNQIVLAHELRHALQDQYADLHSQLSDDLGDFDDRRIAWMSLMEGDATFVMERFVKLRLGGLLDAAGLQGAEGLASDDAGLAGSALIDLPGAPPVVRDHLVQPYLAGLTLARQIWASGGAEAMKAAWQRPPDSTEQVLHPAKYLAGEEPLDVHPRIRPPRGARLLAEGVLGELLLRTLVEQDAERAAAGWGGDGFALWDVSGATVLAWRSEWDTPADAGEFHAALRARFTRHLGDPDRDSGYEVFGHGPGRQFGLRREGDAVELVSADDVGLLRRLVKGAEAPAADDDAGLQDRMAEGGGDAPLPDATATAARSAGAEPAEGEMMGTSTPPAGGTSLGLEPRVAAMLCYLPPLCVCAGFVVSLVVAIAEGRNRLVRFHALQSLLVHAGALVVLLGLQAVAFALSSIGIWSIGGPIWILQMLVLVAVSAGLVLLMIKANAGEEFELPVVGPLARQWV
jgi:uncharacterized membrane protein